MSDKQIDADPRSHDTYVRVRRSSVWPALGCLAGLLTFMFVAGFDKATTWGVAIFAALTLGAFVSAFPAFFLSPLVSSRPDKGSGSKSLIDTETDSL